MKTTGEIIKRKREELGITAEKLGEMTGVTQAYVTMSENNSTNPSKAFLEKIKVILHITIEEEKQIKEMMREQKVDSFSEFLRQNLLKKNYQDRIFESWFSLWQSQKFEQISRDVYEVLVVARENHQVTQEHVSILLTCVQELIAEVNQVQPLSREFREKYMG